MVKWGRSPTCRTAWSHARSSGAQEKKERLFEILRGMGRVLVAFSGGTDSAYLAWAAHRALGDGALAVTADSASIPESHKRDAEAFVAQFGIAHEYIETREFDNPDYARNDPDRCFHCKDELFTRWRKWAASAASSTSSTA
jgi:pyridinium-3,5-biscarboxylic acid mononucleotide sulfurtransferase